jgi:gamma-glutamyltranspeptidase
MNPQHTRHDRRAAACHSGPRFLGLVTVFAFCVACTTAQQTANYAPLFTTTTYAPQNRPDVQGMQGAVSSDHPLASQVGLRVLQQGGNATDAIIAMAGVLAVVRPHMNGIGGDAFGIFYDGETGEIAALNASGGAGEVATPEFFQARGLNRIPGTGALSVSVPGAVAGWVDAHERFGTMNFETLLEPAIDYARSGFPVSTRLAMDFVEQGGSLNEAGKALYLPGGAPPEVGSLLINEALADSLATVASGGKAGFYNGKIATRLADFLTDLGGHLRADDFASHASSWVQPLQSEYLGYTFTVMPPNTQGPAQLALFEMSKHHAIESMQHNSAEYLHLLIELKKLAFADRDRWIADPDYAEIPLDRLLDPDYLRERSQRVDPDRAIESVAPGFGNAGFSSSNGEGNDAGDTVYITAVDQWGNAVSWIQSNFAGFGSGLLDPETGILLHNRGALFTLQPGHPNEIAPGKRPYHTLSPAMALYPDGGFAFSMGTPGGDSQTQSLLQIVHNLLVFGMTPQQAIEAPRFRSSRGLSVAIEDRVSAEVLHELDALGHDLQLVPGWTATFGGAQMIFYNPDTGVLTTAADPRREAYSLAY